MTILFPARYNLATLGGVLCCLLRVRTTHAFASTSRCRRSTTTTRTALQEASLSSLTDVTFTAPKFALDDDDDNDGLYQYPYPSPLHSIHVKSVLSDTESAKCLQLATDYAKQTGRWDQPDADRHASYATCDFPVEECETLDSFLQETGFDNRVWEHMSKLYGVRYEDMTYLDFFCAHYEAEADSGVDIDDQQQQTTMDRLEAHRDGSLLSFTVTLTPPSEFQGGGTFFDALRDVSSPETDPILQAGGAIRPLRAGDAVLHGGKMLHGAAPVTSGQRTVLVGFIDVAEWCYRPGVLSKACCDWGRMDVAAYRWKRQQAKTAEEGQKKGWPLSNQRWLPPSKGRSHIQGFRPAFSSVEVRGDGEYQRRKKLEAEDFLLRNILLPEDERDDLIGGDITIL
jgi:predicted 2-oxoglutarate/Fe(II)-dependent dioxygenase YbiX